MPSTITTYSTSINIVFPVQGQDNDTQGFRDNSIAIKNSLLVASNEITDIQSAQASLTNVVSIISTTVATTSSIGLVKIGSNLDISNSGTISVSPVLNLPKTTTLTINDGSITVDSLYSTYSVSAKNTTTDTIYNINGGTNGQIILLRAADPAQTITVSYTGNIGGDSIFVLFTYQFMTFIKEVSGWYPVRYDYSGTYLPTVTSTSNISSITNVTANYDLNGEGVEVWGIARITATTSGNTSYNISLPFLSNMSSASNLVGSDISSSFDGSSPGLVVAEPGSNTAYIRFNALNASAQDHFYRFHYRLR